MLRPVSQRIKCLTRGRGSGSILKGLLSRILSLSIIVGTSCPKEDPNLPTLTDIFPSSLPYEREIQEFLGIFFEGIPDPRRLFLPDDFPEGVYPLRLDDKGIKPEMVKNAGPPYNLKKEGDQ